MRSKEVPVTICFTPTGEKMPEKLNVSENVDDPQFGEESYEHIMYVPAGCHNLEEVLTRGFA